MFALYAFLISFILCVVDIIFIKVYQLEGYNLKKYIKKVSHGDFAFGGKTPLVFTNRVKRLIFCDFFVKFFLFLLLFGIISFLWLNICLAILAVLLCPFFVWLSFVVIEPVEREIKNSFVKKAKKKLENSSCKTVAITGSFGKTSTKNILKQILKEEFDVCASPKSYNTPMGVCKTILEELKETDDFLIVEFGARKIGDISELAKIVPVDFGIITPIGNCHLETFGSLENIENTKYELCESVQDMMVFNGKSGSSKKLFDRFDKKKYLVAVENSFAYAKDIVSTTSGSDFIFVLNGREFSCHCNLLGKANIDNVVVAGAMAFLLGESIVNIKKGIRNLKPTPHRLQLIKGGIVDVIDDSYNSNFDGFKEALEVLSNFEGKKVVVSPGIVELGKAQVETNVAIGKEVSKVADVFIIMNETNKDSLYKGAKGNCEIFFAKTRQEQSEILKKILNKGDVVLFENDFPDNIK